KYLFATIQTLAKDEQLQRFNPDQFDYILVDEAHRAGATSYQKVLNYFRPNFLLGMTATPERMDDFNLYEMFDYNIAYEIRLQAALDEKMLCPFRYIGITDYEKDGQIVDDTSQLKWLVSDERVDYIVSQTEYYGYSGETLRGLIFCSRTEEANELAMALTKRGYISEALTGQTAQSLRNDIINRLEHGEIQYIITVDVFNEGIDIPCVNQIVMLRNTQSSIVFIQQLGRGLRKFPEKDYVTVIDFIGNYKNNYLIPIALTGDKSRNKNTAREDLELRQVAGISTISFSEIAKERIYKSINNT
ncbi:DEAD/DEAH box helicase, partial [Lactiplantibacillus garii]